jgi:hypothetical protein
MMGIDDLSAIVPAQMLIVRKVSRQREMAEHACLK